MNNQFAKRYFVSRAGVVSIGLLVGGFLCAIWSLKCHEWLRAYLQGVSTTVGGLAVGLLLLQYLLDSQREALVKDLRRGREIALAQAVDRLLARFNSWLPREGLRLTKLYISQLTWTCGRVERVRDLAESVASEMHEPEDRDLVDSLIDNSVDLSDSLEQLIMSLSTPATDSERSKNLSCVWRSADQFSQTACDVRKRVYQRSSMITLVPDHLNHFTSVNPPIPLTAERSEKL
jgi:hypothetical protein